MGIVARCRMIVRMSVDEIVNLVRKMPPKARARLIRRLSALPRASRQPRARRVSAEERAASWARFLELSGMIKGGPTDVSTNKHKYIGDAIWSHKMGRDS